MPELPNIKALFNSPPEAIINQFRKKGYAISWNWQEVWQEANAHAFTVAKATDMEVLKDIREAVEEALTNGTGFRQFQKNLEPKLKAKGWWGKQEVVDPQTGEITEVQLGSPHRLKTIYRTNLSVSYSAGRYKAQIASADRRPWWIYRTAGDGNVRDSHDKLRNTVLRYDDPFWETHYPPNDWGCRCGVDSATDRDLQDRNLRPTSGENIEPFAAKGWEYNPAKSTWHPDTDAFPEELARKYVAKTLEGPGLSVMYDKTNGFVQKLVQQGISADNVLIQFLKKNNREEFPVAVLSKPITQEISTQSHTVILSAETLAKNILHHPELEFNDYRNLQNALESAQLVVKDSNKTLLFYYRSEQSNEQFSAVKATRDGEKMYLTSFRLASRQKVDNIRKRGRVIKDEL